MIDQHQHTNQVEHANRLRHSIEAPEILVFPELWDVATGQVLVDAGFEVLGTSATAIAWSHGYRAHERMRLEDLLMAAARIVRRNDIPVNADLEGGIGRSISEVKKAVKAAVAVGCAGVTIGDGSRAGAHGIMPVEEMSNYIKAARMAAIEAEIPLCITARTEEFQLGALGQSPLDSTIRRAEQYFQAGADCLLVAGIQNKHVVQKLVETIDGPVSIAIDLSSAPNIKEYGQIGVASIALGTSIMRALLGNLQVKAEELLAFGDFAHLDKAMSQDDVNALLT